MKTLKILFLLLFVSLLIHAQNEKIVFLHHSTGGLIYKKGGIPELMEEYNTINATNYSIVERAFPNKPYPWRNYPYDYWNIWMNGYCEDNRDTEEYENVECLETLTKKYDVIMLKHCFPGAKVLENTGMPDIASDRKSLENYKLQYRALRDKFDSFPENDFIMWTLVPLHRLANGGAENAERAKEFVDWVKNVWLKEDGKEHPNIHIFDYFSLAAETDKSAGDPNVMYCLKYEYERSHKDSDSHPNDLACKTIGPAFFKFIVNTLSGK